eukprot:507222-Pelagomonas_calceolata.AAC.2
MTAPVQRTLQTTGSAAPCFVLPAGMQRRELRPVAPEPWTERPQTTAHEYTWQRNKHIQSDRSCTQRVYMGLGLRDRRQLRVSTRGKGTNTFRVTGLAYSVRSWALDQGTVEHCA